MLSLTLLCSCATLSYSFYQLVWLALEVLCFGWLKCLLFEENLAATRKCKNLWRHPVLDVSFLFCHSYWQPVFRGECLHGHNVEFCFVSTSNWSVFLFCLILCSFSSPFLCYCYHLPHRVTAASCVHEIWQCQYSWLRVTWRWGPAGLISVNQADPSLADCFAR